MYIETNKYQTPITDELLAEYPEEVQEWFYDFVTNVPFIKNLISPDRKYARDLPRDDKGRIIVDITNPHIIEDADYFRQPALHFMKHQCYTFLKPNSNPHSEYRRFWDEELRRCRDGYVRPSDGEWVTGFCYWFLNYCPMMVNMITEGRKKAIRTESFPFFFEGIYLRFHYLWQARENGKHAIELAKRGAHPYDEKVFTPQGWKLWADINIGSQLFDTTGAITTVIDISSNGLMPVYKITLRDGRQVKCSDDHKWVVKIHNHKQVEILSTLELLNIYKKRRKISVRIPSGIEHTTKILKNNGVNLPYKDTLVDPYTFGLLLGDGCFRHKSCYFTQHPKDLQEERNYIPYEIIQWKNKYSYRIVIPNWSTILNTYNLNNKKSEDKFIPDEFKYNSKEVRLNILKGLMDSDGSIHGGVPNINTTSEKLRNDIIEVARSLGYQSCYVKKKAGYKVKGIYKECLPSYDISIYADSEIFNLNRKKILVKYNSTNAKSRKEGSIITNIEYLGEDFCKCVEVDSKDSCYLIGDFITTHNCAKSYSLASIMSHNLILGENAESCRRVITVLTAYEKEYLKDDKDGTLSKFKPAINFQFTNTPFPHLLLKNSPNEMTWQMGYKDELGIERGSLNQVLGVSAKDNPDKLRGKRGWILFEEMGSFKGLLALYDTTRKSVEDGDYTFATMYLVGTAAEKESDFSSAKTLLYSPDGYNILALPNVYDKQKQGKAEFGFFFPSYVNRAGCYNKDGVSDVVKALLQILTARYKAKYSADPKSVLRVIAEDPVTPQEAIIKVKNAYFPIQQIEERIAQIDQNPRFYDDTYVGFMVQNQNGEAEFKNTADIPIRDFPTADNKEHGAIEIFVMPEKDSRGKKFENRYIAGIDPIDNDSSETMSLFSIHILDLFTDQLVAEYTGRLDFVDDCYEQARLLLMFYNAVANYENNLKGLYSYFRKMNCTHLLCDTPEYLKDKQLIKVTSTGNNIKGVRATAPINNYANGLLRDWLLKPVTIISKNEEGQDTEVSIPNLFLIKNRAVLKELALFTPEMNVDRIRALGMLMLYREEKIILYQGDMSKVAEEKIDSDYLGNDDYFSRNFKVNQRQFSKFSKFNILG